MTKKTFIAITITGLILAIVIVAVLLYVLSPDTAEKPVSPQSTGKSSNGKPPIQSEGGAAKNFIYLQASDGGTIQTKDIRRDPDLVKDPLNPGFYSLGYNLYGQRTSDPPYVIEYIDTTQYFNISLLQQPIGRFRKEAERYLLEHLGISTSEMCRLQYMIAVPYTVDKTYSARSLGFSFCPGSVSLPE